MEVAIRANGRSTGAGNQRKRNWASELFARLCFSASVITSSPLNKRYTNIVEMIMSNTNASCQISCADYGESLPLDDLIQGGQTGFAAGELRLQ